MPHDRPAEQRLRELGGRRAAASFLEELTQFEHRATRCRAGIALERHCHRGPHFAAHEEGEATCAEVVHLGNFGRDVVRDDEIVVVRLNGRVLQRE